MATIGNKDTAPPAIGRMEAWVHERLADYDRKPGQFGSDLAEKAREQDARVRELAGALKAARPLLVYQMVKAQDVGDVELHGRACDTVNAIDAVLARVEAGGTQ